MAVQARSRVLVADDDPLFLSALAEFVLGDPTLQLVGMAADAGQAIELASRYQPDIALLDCRMPGGGGPRAAREIRARLPRTRIMALSGHEDQASVFEMLQAGAVSYVVKRSPGEILPAIHRCLEGQATLSPEVTGAIVHALAARLEGQRQEAEVRRQRAGQVQRLLDTDGLRVAFQPMADLRNGHIFGVEALARFPGDPPLSPAAWFAQASEVGLRLELELAAVRAALSHLPSLPPDVGLSINLSPEIVIAAPCQQILAVVPSERLIVEVTEDAPVKDYEAINEALRAVRARGGRLAIDDAGAGFASLQHILRMNPDIIKLDLTLTRGIDADRPRRALATALIAFASEIGASVIAEGIETAAEATVLRDLGVFYGQGYYLAKPGPLPREWMISAIGDTRESSAA
jgi:EAL domain-containing protein (putative c-di-GMP-specific phosphodiesterase class I)/CheY-like chemotaxis protein